MKLIIKNDNRDIVKNPNIKIIETTEASFTNQIVFIEENDVPIIKYTDTGSMYFVKNLDNLYDRKSKSEVLLDITIDNLESIGGGSSEPVDLRPYKVYTALLTQSGTDAPVATVLENTLGAISFTYEDIGTYNIVSDGLFIEGKTWYNISSASETGNMLDGLGGLKRTDVNNISVLTIASGVDVFNDILNSTPIEIRVYN